MEEREETFYNYRNGQPQLDGCLNVIMMICHCLGGDRGQEKKRRQVVENRTGEVRSAVLELCRRESG